MRFLYRRWDGHEFQTQEHLEFFGQFLELLLEHGDAAMDALGAFEMDPDQRKILEKWIEDGLLEKVGARFRLTPRAINSLQRKALMEVFRGLRPDSAEGHETTHTRLSARPTSSAAHPERVRPRYSQRVA